MARNVLGSALEPCCMDPITGFYRTGACETGPEDHGLHVVCIRVTAEFLAFSTEVGNDLATSHPEFHFPGLKPGDRWCLCALRWKQADEAGMAPPVHLKATHISALEFIDLDRLRAYAVDDPAAN